MKRLLFSVMCVTLLVGCDNGKKEGVKENILVVDVIKAESITPQTRESFAFISKPYKTSTLSFRVSGPLAMFDIQSGKYYSKGQTIARIDTRDFKIRKERTEAVYNQAKAEFERIETLYHKKNLSASAYEKAKADYTSAKTAFQTASNELSDCVLAAPFNGYIGEVFQEKHQDVKATQPILSFEELGRLKIEAYVTQNIASAAQKLNNTHVVFDGVEQNNYPVTIQEVSKSTTSNNLSYLVSAVFDNSKEQLLAGMSGQMIFNNDSLATKSWIAIPQSTINHKPSIGDFVWVIDAANETAHIRPIKRGRFLPNGYVEVVAGLEADVLIARSGYRFLADGGRIKLKNS
jgi:RND family efflux transporter MFP subunit